jgi:hypothetical protein
MQPLFSPSFLILTRSHYKAVELEGQQRVKDTGVQKEKLFNLHFKAHLYNLYESSYFTISKPIHPHVLSLGLVMFHYKSRTRARVLCYIHSSDKP